MDGRVQSLLDSIQMVVLELDGLREQLIAESISFAKVTTTSFMQTAISEHANKIQALGANGLRPIKDEFQSILSSLDGITIKILDTESVWPYRKVIDLNNIEELESRTFYIYGRRLPEHFEKALRAILSPIGKLLAKYELASDDCWKQQGNYYWYTFGLPTTDALLASARRFDVKHKEYESLIRELVAAQREAQQESALGLWESV